MPGVRDTFSTTAGARTRPTGVNLPLTSHRLLERRSWRLIGDCGLYLRDGEAELGYTLDRDHWGRGYGTEAAGLCVGAAFDGLGLPRVVALARPENGGSIGVLLKLGFEAHGKAEAHGSEHALYRLDRERHESRRNRR